MPALILRRLRTRDAEAYRAIRLEALRLHPNCFASSFESEETQPLAFFKKRISDSTLLGAFLNEGLVGTAGLRAENSAKIEHVAHIWGVYVQSHLRGYGVASKLMSELLVAARGYRSIRLTVTVGNEAALALYASLGFEAGARDREALKVNDEFYDEILMRLDQRAPSLYSDGIC
ncbi:GNAT family N-acetyltransferase [Limoniibacter endophyticus]|uniref:N-acetyltransferase n=1 Tax=Limoniibacter endophyticus TaxID=1565040 RepID=A0A8J3GGU8_9HYPH|nr:GNAT family N-acetyltransferase [Limoniibacter endophyticus]GHC62371.1 N-acetyltransferase [Limoniibacter endophyticus]